MPQQIKPHPPTHPMLLNTYAPGCLHLDHHCLLPLKQFELIIQWGHFEEEMVVKVGGIVYFKWCCGGVQEEPQGGLPYYYSIQISI